MGKKVLHVLSSNSYSGAENVVCQIIDSFKEEIAMAYCSPNGPIKETLEEKQVSFYPMKKVTINELRKVVKAYQPNIIHAHDIRASIIAAHFSKHIPVISHIHCKFEEMTKLSFKSLLYRVYLSSYHHIFTVSESIIKEYYFSYALSEKSSVLRNVVSEERLKEMAISGTETDENDFIFIGRFSYQKDPLRLIHIISKITKKLPDAKFILIGNGSMLDDAKKLAEELNIEKNITFTGFLKNPFPVLKSSKVMLMCSRMEGLPMCVLESMLFGVPIVSTGVDGIKEVIDNGIDGFYFDTDEEIVNTACQLIQDERERKNISQHAYRKAVVLNNVGNYKQKLLKVYDLHKRY